jgi:hypothetical protein
MNKTFFNETILGPFIQMATFDWPLFRLALELIVCRMFSGQQMTLQHNSFEWQWPHHGATFVDYFTNSINFEEV